MSVRCHSGRSLGVWQPPSVSAPVALYSPALRGSQQGLDRAPGEPRRTGPRRLLIANAPSAGSTCRDGGEGCRHRPDAPYPADGPDGAGGPSRPPGNRTRPARPAHRGDGALTGRARDGRAGRPRAAAPATPSPASCSTSRTGPRRNAASSATQSCVWSAPRTARSPSSSHPSATAPTVARHRGRTTHGPPVSRRSTPCRCRSHPAPS